MLSSTLRRIFLLGFASAISVAAAAAPDAAANAANAANAATAATAATATAAAVPVPASVPASVSAPAPAASPAILVVKNEALSQDAAAGLVAQAVRYEHGEGVERDYLRAASLYCSAARVGNVDALYGLGWMYANGRGMPVDDGYAARLFRMAAEGGHRHAGLLVSRIVSASEAGLPPCLVFDKENAAAPVVAKEENVAPSRDLKNLSGARLHKLVSKLAPKYNIDVNLALAIMYIESGFNVQATSPKNAQGLMQLMPETAQRFNVRKPYDAEDNIKGGLAYLRWLLAYFEGDVALVAAAYNAGEGAVERYKGVPPYPETKAYVAKLNALYRRAKHPYDAAAAVKLAGFRAEKAPSKTRPRLN